LIRYYKAQSPPPSPFSSNEDRSSSTNNGFVLRESGFHQKAKETVVDWFKTDYHKSWGNLFDAGRKRIVFQEYPLCIFGKHREFDSWKENWDTLWPKATGKRVPKGFVPTYDNVVQILGQELRLGSNTGFIAVKKPDVVVSYADEGKPFLVVEISHTNPKSDSEVQTMKNKGVINAIEVDAFEILKHDVYNRPDTFVYKRLI
jgi:hypothetical protein